MEKCSDYSSGMSSNIITEQPHFVLKYSLLWPINNSRPPNLPEPLLEKEYLCIQECPKLIFIMGKESDMLSNLVSVKKSIQILLILRSKKFKRVNKIIRVYHSKILNQNLRITMSMKAFRCINKMGSFDNYILCTKPKDLDSKFGEYLREIMLRKINDPEYRLPYILGTNRKLRIRKYYRYLYNKENSKFVVPKEFKKNFETFQRKFGSSVDELSNEDYKKYLEL